MRGKTAGFPTCDPAGSLKSCETRKSSVRHLMATRRQFLKYGGAAAFAATAPLPTLVAEHKQLPVRPIPRTGESLPVVGMGNSNAFRSGDREASWDVMKMFQRYGSRYIDCSGDSRFVVADVVAKR